LPLAAFFAATAIVFTACGGAASPSPAASSPGASQPASEAPSQSEAPYTGMSYPETGDAPCGQAPYTGIMKKITAKDRLTVEFQLCAPDPAFLPKVAFSVFGIWDSDYLAKHAPDKSYLQNPVGTGPYKVKEWSQGNRLVYEINNDYWGTKALTPGLELRWSDEAAQRLLELQSGNVDGIDNPGTDDIATIKANSELKFYPREGMNTFYLGFNVNDKPWDNEKIRKAIAMGIDRDRIVKNYYPEGSQVADYFTPCSVPFGCEGDKTWSFDLTQAKQLLQQGMQEEAEAEPRDRREPRPPGIGRVPRRECRRHPRRDLPARLGRRLSGPDELPRLPLRGRLGQEVRQAVR
jgi:ABC-type oligopeptide transport system substrate-binding subunit